MPDLNPYKYYIAIAAIIGLLVGSYLFGQRVQHNKDIIAQDKAISDQKTADILACTNSKETGARHGEEFKQNTDRANSDYDNWMWNEANCASNSGNGVTAIVGNDTAKQSIVLPAGTRLVNSVKYGQILRDADYQRAQLINLQQCVRNINGCRYP